MDGSSLRQLRLRSRWRRSRRATGEASTTQERGCTRRCRPQPAAPRPRAECRRATAAPCRCSAATRTVVARAARQLERQRLPVGVEHGMQQEARQRRLRSGEGQRMRVVAPVGPAERHAVPFDVRPLQQLVQGERVLVVHDVASLAERRRAAGRTGARRRAARAASSRTSSTSSSWQ